jgi:hypothetical protein
MAIFVVLISPEATVAIDATDQQGLGFGPCGRVTVALLVELGLHRVNAKGRSCRGTPRYSLIVRTTLAVGRPPRVGSLASLRIASS